MQTNGSAKIMTLDEVFKDDDLKTHLGKKVKELKEAVVRAETPPFPRVLMMEISNICNHKCTFCAITSMSRPKQYIKPETFKRVVAEAYELGAREISMVGGAEPLANKQLEEYISFCRDIGYEYIYITSNATLADAARWKRILDAGVHSIKLSINGGDPESYLAVHGRDGFEKAIESVRIISEYRKKLDRKIYLGVSFVETAGNVGTFEKLRDLIEPYVDEILRSQPYNPSGQRPDQPPDLVTFVDGLCYQPFSRAHVSREGYLRTCCSDYENDLAVEDLANLSLSEAWVSSRFKNLRHKHLENGKNKESLKGLLCHRCMYGGEDDYQSLNPDLSSRA